jgi:hypothetical protein
MKINRPFATISLLLATALLAGCAGFPGTEPSKPVAVQKPPRADSPRSTPAPAVAPQLAPDQLALREGIEFYNSGKYNEAIKRLSANEIANSSREVQLSAIKHTAFSYCVTQRQLQCRQQFDKALKLDPNFQLAPGENGHPLWTPVFLKAKKEKR